jgi:hypothetical protein
VKKKSSFEEDLFGDLNLQEEEVASEHSLMPKLTQVPGRETLSMPTMSPIIEQTLLHQTSPTGINTRSALKEPPPLRNWLLLIVVSLVLVISAGVGGMYWLEIWPFAQKVVPQITSPSQSRPVKIQQIAIDSTPQGAEIWVNQKLYEHKTPTTLKVLSNRSYSFVFKLDNYEEEKRELEIKAVAKPIELKIEFTQKSGTAVVQKSIPVDPSSDRGLGYVRVRCDPVGATIKLGLKPEIKCPATIEIDGGTHPLKVEMDGYESFASGITVEPGQIREIRVSLEQIDPSQLRKTKKLKSAVAKKTAALTKTKGSQNSAKRIGNVKVSIESESPARVYWRGRLLGKTPLTTNLPAGRQIIELRGQGGLIRTATLQVNPRQANQHKFTFRYGHIRFDVRPWADVLLNGRKIGQTPFPPHKIREGVYTVELRMNKLSHKQQVKVVGNSTAMVFYMFARP